MKRLQRSAVLGLTAAAGIAAVAVGVAPRLRGSVPQKPVLRLADTAPDKDGATLLPNGWKVTPAGKAIELPGDLPMGMALTPDGKYLLVNTTGYHDHGVSVIDISGTKRLQTVDLGKNWGGLGFDPASGDIYVSSGGTPTDKYLTGAAKEGVTADQVEALKKPILHLSLANGALAMQPSVDLAGLADNARWVSGIVSGPDGALYVTNLDSDTLYKLTGSPKAVQASVTVGRKPYGVALSPDGKTLAVSNWGDGTVSLLDPATLKESGRVTVGSHPNSLAWAKDGRLYVANSGSNSVSVIADGKVAETVKTSLNANDPVGSTPDAVAVSPDGKRVYVANADNNDVAVIDTSDAKESRILGFIPTGWYPTALALSNDGKKLFVGTGKGLKFRPNAKPGTKVISQESLSRYDYIGNCLNGAVSVVDVPGDKQLASYTQQVQANTPTAQKVEAQAPYADEIRKGSLSRIKHVVYIIRENRTYDQVFGDLPQGNGDPKLCLFGDKVTPNAHRIAQDYVLLDNLYCNGEVSQDGHQWCDAAYATDWNERAWTNSYSGRGEPKDNAGLGSSPAGYLWDNCAKHGMTYKNYGEAATFTSNPNEPPHFTGAKALDGHASYAYSQIPTFGKTRDVGRADVFIQDLHDAEKTGEWPQLMVMSMGEDHTQGLQAGKFTPTANVGDNDQALGKLVDAVSHSKFWQETAIFVIEDDAQNGPDHVDAHRTVGLVISPYVRHGIVDSTMYTTASFVRTIEAILGLPPMTQFDAAATPLYNAFTTAPTQTAYNTLPPGVDLEARNPKKGAGAVASAKLDLSEPDRADPDALNLILWNALKPGVPMPAPVRSARLMSGGQPMAIAKDDDD